MKPMLLKMKNLDNSRSMVMILQKMSRFCHQKEKFSQLISLTRRKSSENYLMRMRLSLESYKKHKITPKA